MRWGVLALLILGGWWGHQVSAADVREPPPVDDPAAQQWMRDVSRRMHVLTVTNRVPHGRTTGRRGQLLMVITSTNAWLFVNSTEGAAVGTTWKEIDAQ